MIRRAATVAARSFPLLRHTTSFFFNRQGSIVNPLEGEHYEKYVGFVSRFPLETTGDRFAKYTAFESPSQMKLSDNVDKPNIFLYRYAHGNQVLTPISVEDDGSLLPKKSIIPPFRYGHPEMEGIYCCNGVLCYPVGDDEVELFVWNPTTSETRKLPNPPHNIYNSTNAPGVTKVNLFTAIWADPNHKSADYKVIRMYSYVYNHAHLGHPVQIELYSLKTDSWKNIIYSEEYELSPCGRPHCYINGVIYMICYLTKSEKIINIWARSQQNISIISFDFHNETFFTIPFPEMKYGGPSFYEVVNYNGQLSLLILTSSLYDDKRIFAHYVMRNGEWHIVGECYVPFCGSPIGFARNGELLLFEHQYIDFESGMIKTKLGVFDSTTGEFKHVPGCDSDGSNLILFESNSNQLHQGSRELMME